MQIGLTPWTIPDDPNGGTARLLEQAELGERLGFHSFWLPESHFVSKGAYPAPLLLLAAVAGRTSRIRLGTTSYLLPIRHPIHVAEEVGVLEQISGGRVILGIGRGFRPELFEAFQVVRAEKRGRFEAALESILAAWNGDAITSNPDARLHPLPVQKPHPPIWVAAFGPKALAQAGRLNLPYFASPIEPLSKLIDNYALHREARPKDSDEMLPVPVIRTLFVTHETSTERRVRDALETQSRALSRQGGTIGRAGGAALDEWALVGDPARIRDQLAAYRETIGATHVIARGGVPGADEQEQERSIQLLAELAATSGE